MVSFRGLGWLAIIGFLGSAIVVGVALRAVLGDGAADLSTAAVFGISLLASAAITWLLALRGATGGMSNKGRNEVMGLPLERAALLEGVAGVVAIVAGVLKLV